MSKVLYIRDVPDEVQEALAQLAKREGLSLSAFAVRELSETARRLRNAEILAQVPNLGLSAESIVATVHEDRANRAAAIDEAASPE